MFVCATQSIEITFSVLKYSDNYYRKWHDKNHNWGGNILRIFKGVLFKKTQVCLNLTKLCNDTTNTMITKLNLTCD